jgi:hypothetical protein
MTKIQTAEIASHGQKRSLIVRSRRVLIEQTQQLTFQLLKHLDNACFDADQSTFDWRTVKRDFGVRPEPPRAELDSE